MEARKKERIFEHLLNEMLDDQLIKRFVIFIGDIYIKVSTNKKNQNIYFSLWRYLILHHYQQGRGSEKVLQRKLWGFFML